MMQPSDPQESLIEFPCEFPIKVMGLRREGFAQAMIEALSDLVPNIAAEKIEMRVSKQATYISLTLYVDTHSKAHLDQIYLRLTGHPWVKVVL
jgi:putative lipoic acid-binding regulatory protein